MRKFLRLLMILLACAGPVLPVSAEPTAEAEQQQEVVTEEAAQVQAEEREEKGSEEKERDEGWSGMTIFLLVFIFSLLFVIHTATGLSQLGDKVQTPPKPSPPQRRNKQEEDPQRRFRL